MHLHFGEVQKKCKWLQSPSGAPNAIWRAPNAKSPAKCDLTSDLAYLAFDLASYASRNDVCLTPSDPYGTRTPQYLLGNNGETPNKCKTGAKTPMWRNTRFGVFLARRSPGPFQYASPSKQLSDQSPLGRQLSPVELRRFLVPPEAPCSALFGGIFFPGRFISGAGGHGCWFWHGRQARS